MGSFSRAIVYLNICAALAVLVRLYLSRLFQIYRRLVLYLAFYAVEFATTAAIPIHSTMYGNFYMLSESVNVILSLLVVLELYNLALTGRPALAAASRKIIAYAMVAGALAAGLAATLDSNIRPGQSLVMHRFFTVERSLDLILLVFLVLISGFVAWFPVMVRRNVAIYVVGFAVFYVSRMFGLLAANLLPARALTAVSNSLLGCALACLLLWLFGLRREDSGDFAVAAPLRTEASVKRLAGQLDAINAALVRLGRRHT